MFSSVLIANRGEIAVRIMRTAHRMGLRCIAVYSDADADAMHVAQADAAYRIGPPPAAESYLDANAIIDAAMRSGADAIHPGYGFLSENPAFVDACEAAGLVFIGPPASAIRAMGLKDAAKQLMEAAGVPVVPGYHGARQEPAFLAGEATRIGYPVLIKARAGGGGKGMRRVEEAKAFKAALASAQREAASSFGDPGVIVETYVAKPRHIEVQVFADAYGNAVHLFERDCSLQRRHQKVMEEAPGPGMTAELRAAMGAAAVKAALAVGYRGAGTVEFIVDASEGLRADRFFFMEMNTRLQVEHPVTEAITGLDLVEWQLRVAAGEPLPAGQSDLRIEGHAFEARIYAEDPERNFAPAVGRLDLLELPAELARIDTGVRPGDVITPFYDPMIAKLIVHGPTRAGALARLAHALDHTRAPGSTTNIGFLRVLARHPGFVAGDVDTGLIERDLAALTAAPQPSAETVAVAALAALGLIAGKPSAKPDPWDARVGWRQWGAATCHADLAWSGERMAARIVMRGPSQHEVTITRDMITRGMKTGETITGETITGKLAGEAARATVSVRVRDVSGDRVRLEMNGRSETARVTRLSDGLAIVLAGQEHSFTIPDPLVDTREDGAAADRVLSPMPGLVKLVATQVGAKVAKSDPLVVVEAMKMEHTLTAPRDGIVAEILACVGEIVQDGVVLVRLEATT